MATVNHRTKTVQALTINGIAAGGLMSVAIHTGYDLTLQSEPDGLGGPPLEDDSVEFCRGTIVTQDWVHVLELLTGTLGTCVLYERKSGVAAATGYVKHTITNPVIHRVRLAVRKDGYATCQAEFECKAADEDAGFADMWTQQDGRAAPDYVAAARGGHRVQSAALGSISIHHVMDFELNVATQLMRACNDGDTGYTTVEPEEEGMQVTGSIGFQSGVIDATTTQHIVQDLLGVARGNLVLTMSQGGGAAAQVLTIAGVKCSTGRPQMGREYATHSMDWRVTNDVTTPLTLTGTNKIITVAAAA